MLFANQILHNSLNNFNRNLIGYLNTSTINTLLKIDITDNFDKIKENFPLGKFTIPFNKTDKFIDVISVLLNEKEKAKFVVQDTFNIIKKRKDNANYDIYYIKSPDFVLMRFKSKDDMIKIQYINGHFINSKF